MTVFPVSKPSLDAACRAFVDGLDDGFALVRLDSIAAANAAFARLLGIPASSLTGLKVGALVAPDRREEIDAWLDAILSGSEYQVRGETTLRRADGGLLPARLSLSRFVTDDGGVAALVHVRDISTERHAEDARDAAERRFQSMFENAVEGIYQTTPDGHYLAVNPALAAIYGYDTPDALIASLTDIARQLYVDPSARDRFRAALANDSVVRNFEAEVYRRDGTRIWITENARCVRNERGEIVYYEGTVEDITERKRAEEQGRLYRQALEDKERAEIATRAKSEFLAMMSHEIRTPMNGVLGMARLLLGTELDGTQRDYVHTILDSGKLLLTILNDILDYSKLEAGKLEIESVDFDLRQEIEAVVALLGTRAGEKGIGLDVELGQDVPRWLKGDPMRLRQVMLNLGGNAIKFTERGGVTLRVGLRGRSAGGAARLIMSVVDTGMGISESAKAKLFGSFTQVDSSITRRFGGTGLGLAISKRLVELMGGEIGVESELGRGSTFWFTLEMPDGAEPADTVEPNFGGRIPRLRILLAEDNPVNQKVAVGLLRQLGHQVKVVENGYQAVSACMADDYQLVLMDMHMPEMGGVEATRLIRLLPGTRGKVPIVALTASASPDSIERNLAAGMNDFVAKPIQPGALEGALLRIFGTAPVAEETDAIGEPAARAEDPAVDGEVIGRLERELGRDMVVELVADFLRLSVELYDRMTAARQRGDLPTWAEAAHSLKGASGSLGLTRVYRTTAALEKACRNNKENEASEAFATLKRHLEDAWRELCRRYAEWLKNSHVSLPEVEEPAAEEPVDRRRQPKGMDIGKLSVLVVEDEPFARKLTTSVLRQIGVRSVTAVRSGREALEVLERQPGDIDLVISDWNMPEMTGLNLLRKVRERLPDIPFIMLTANTTGDFVLAARDGGVDGYIAKPFAQGQLAAKIASVLRINIPA